jgi:hypothetical protein
MAECGYRGCAALRRLAAHDHRNPCVTCWTVDEKACCRYRSLGTQISLSASDRTTWSALQHTLAKVILTAAGGMLPLLCHRHEGQRPAARAGDGAAGRRAGRAWRRRNNPSASRCLRGRWILGTCVGSWRRCTAKLVIANWVAESSMARLRKYSVVPQQLVPPALLHVAVLNCPD